MSNEYGARRRSGTGARVVRMLLVPLCLGAAVPRLSAQVGYEPQQSPFRDINTRQTFTPFISEFFGNRGHAGVGAQSALAIGGRFTTALSGPLELWATLAVINSKRDVIDPSLPDSTRVSGPVDYRLISADLGLALRLTGARSFHGLEPYIGVAFGVVAPSATVTDPGGFSASSHLTFVPTIGTRARLGKVLSLTLEARDNLVKYEWPSCYFGPAYCTTAVAPAVLDATTEKDTQMTHNFSLTAGLSFHFNF